MRIWAFPFFYPYDYPGRRWAGTFAHRQYQGLIENGAELTVVLPVMWHPPEFIASLDKGWKAAAELNYPYKRVHDGITVYHPRIANMRPKKLFRKSYPERYVDAIAKFFSDNNIKLDPHNDIFYSQWLPGSVLVTRAAHRLGVRSAILGIGDDVIIWPNEKEENKKYFAEVVTESDARFYCADYLGREANKIIGKDLHYDVTYFGVDYNEFKPAPELRIALQKEYGIPHDKVVVLIVGSALVRKGWIDLMDAMQKIKATTDNFVLVGGHAGPTDVNVTDEIKKRGLTANFVDLGEIKPENLSKVYNTADIFCLPSHWEGLATVVMESMSTGLPVITTNVCGHPEIIENGVTGILIPPKRVDLLYEQLLALINDSAKREMLGRNAREFIVTKWGNFTENAEKLYEKLQNVAK